MVKRSQLPGQHKQTSSNGNANNHSDAKSGDGQALIGSSPSSSAPSPKEDSSKLVELKLLNGVYGYAKPRMLVALMGPTGAGKSTLLDVLVCDDLFQNTESILEPAYSTE